MIPYPTNSKHPILSVSHPSPPPPPLFSYQQKYGNSGSQTADLDRQTDAELVKLK